MVQFRRDLRLCFNFAEVKQSNTSNLKFYVKSKYQPSHGFFEIENVINSFERRVLLERNIIHVRHTPSTNLNAIQSQTLNHIRSQTSIDIIILNASTPSISVWQNLSWHISRKRLQNTYDDSCQFILSCIHNDETDDDLKINRLTVAYSHPKKSLWHSIPFNPCRKR